MRGVTAAQNDQLCMPRLVDSEYPESAPNGGDARLGSCRVPIARRGGCRLLGQLRLGLAGRGRVMEDDAAVR
jgi:hypothetical protein